MDIGDVKLMETGEAGVEPDAGPEVSDTTTEDGSLAAGQSPEESTPSGGLPSGESSAATESGEPSTRERYEQWLENGADPLEFLQDDLLPEAYPRRAKQMRDIQRAFTQARQGQNELAKALEEVRGIRDELKADKRQFEQETADEVGSEAGIGDDGESLVFDRKKYDELLLDDPSGVSAQLYRLQCDSQQKDRVLRDLRGYIQKQEKREQEMATTQKEREKRLAERVALGEEYTEEFGLTPDQANLAVSFEHGDRYAGFNPSRPAIAKMVKKLMPKTQAELAEVLSEQSKPVSKKGTTPSEAIGADILKRAMKSAGKPSRPEAGSPAATKADADIWAKDIRKAARSVAERITLVPG